MGAERFFNNSNSQNATAKRKFTLLGSQPQPVHPVNVSSRFDREVSRPGWNEEKESDRYSCKTRKANGGVTEVMVHVIDLKTPAASSRADALGY